MRIKILLMAVVLTGLLFSLSASAILTDPSCGVVPIQKLNYATVTSVDKFDSTLGQLLSVRIYGEACGNISREISSEDLNPDGVDYRVICVGRVIANLPSQGPQTFEIKLDDAKHLDPDDETGAPDWTGNDYWSLYTEDCSEIQEYIITDPALMAPYIGSAGEKISIPVNTSSSNTVEGSNEYYSRGGTYMGVTICVQYEYQPKLCINGSKIGCEGEPLSGWTITLTKPDGSTETRVTDSNGEYSFCNLIPGNYRVTEETRPGWYPIGPTFYDVQLVDEDVEVPAFQNTEHFCISGYKYNVTSGEEPLEGWTITLTKPDGSKVTDVTDANGYYEFCDLANGQYTVSEELKSGWIAKSPTSVLVDLYCDNASVDFRNARQPNLVCVCPFFIKNELYTASSKEVKVVDASKGILANDPAGSIVLNPESISIDPKYGTIEVHQDGSFVYDPTVATGKLYNGLYVTFKYSANNGLCDSKYPGTAKIQIRS